MKRAAKNFVAIFFLILASVTVLAQNSIITTVAGAHMANHKPALSASFADLVSAAVDGEGNLYLGDTSHCQVRRVDRHGSITTFAGGDHCGFAGDGGQAKSALLSSTFGLCFDLQGDLLIADGGNARIRKVTKAGKIMTIAGNGVFGYSGDGGPATQASLSFPEGLFADAFGNLYIADTNNFVVRVVDASGMIHTVAGNHVQGFARDGGPATSASMDFPQGVVADNQGNFYFTDGNNDRVRKVDSGGTISTFAGNGQFPFGNNGSGGPATNASLGDALGLLISDGKLYISTISGFIWAVDLNDQIANIVAGTGVQGFGGDGQSALSATFNQPWGMAMTASGDLIIADSSNARARQISRSTQIASTVAGGFLGDGGPALDSAINVFFGGGLAFDATGNLYIADSQNNRVRKVSTSGIITTFAGSGISGYSGDGGPAANALLSAPTAVAVDQTGNVYIADSVNGVVRKVDTNGIISTFSRPGLFGLISLLPGIAVDKQDNIYVSDGLFAVWKLDSFGNSRLFAGTEFGGGIDADGIPATQAFLNAPAGLAVDGQGNVYIAEWFKNRIRKVDVNGIISTVAGNGVAGFNGDGIPASSASLFEPTDIAVDSAGTLYISDWVNFRIRSVDGAGIIHTYAGSGIGGFNGDNLPALQSNIAPTSVAINPQGLILFTDEGSFRVREVKP